MPPHGICKDFDSHVVTEFEYVSRLVSGAYDTINMPSIEEDEVGTHENFVLCIL